MDGQTDERTDRRTDGRTDGPMDGRMDGWTEGWTDGRTDERTDGRTDGRMDGRTDGWTDGRMDRQTDGLTRQGVESCVRDLGDVSSEGVKRVSIAFLVKRVFSSKVTEKNRARNKNRSLYPSVTGRASYRLANQARI